MSEEVTISKSVIGIMERAKEKFLSSDREYGDVVSAAIGRSLLYAIATARYDDRVLINDVIGWINQKVEEFKDL